MEAAEAEEIARLREQLAAMTLAKRAAEARADAEAKARVAAEERVFVTDMRAIAATSSDATTGADTRRNMQDPIESNEMVFSSLPAVADDRVAEAWQSFCDASKRAADVGGAIEGAAPAAAVAGKKLHEVRHVHPVIERLLKACLTSGDNLRLFHDEVVHDDMTVAKAQPDFSVTHARDATASLLGAVFMVEVKLPGALGVATRQALGYGRRRVFKLFTEARNRGEAGNDVHVYVAGTDGRHVKLARIDSGAPLPGGSWAAARPCPTVVTAPLELLLGWAAIMPPKPPQSPPAAIPALLRVLAAASGGLVYSESPLESLQVSWASGAGTEPTRVPLGNRIARGGTSDVYAVAGDEHSVVKVGRFVSAGINDMYDAEEAALGALAGSDARAHGLVPTLQQHGSRLLHLSPCEKSLPWRVLMLSPAGTPLEAWLDARMHGFDNGGDVDLMDARLLRLADLVLGDVVAALRAAHARMLVHCDVRPSNVVIVDDDDGGGGGSGGGGSADPDDFRPFHAVLVDWGVSRSVKSQCFGVGVVAVADARVFDESVGSVKASPVHDYVSAAHLWLCVAKGQGRVPWLGGGSDASWLAAREDWLGEKVNDPSAAVRAVVGAVKRWSTTTDAVEVEVEAVRLWPPRSAWSHTGRT
jgi:hypothetical protein